MLKVNLDAPHLRVRKLGGREEVSHEELRDLPKLTEENPESEIYVFYFKTFFFYYHMEILILKFGSHSWSEVTPFNLFILIPTSLKGANIIVTMRKMLFHFLKNLKDK